MTAYSNTSPSVRCTFIYTTRRANVESRPEMVGRESLAAASVAYARTLPFAIVQCYCEPMVCLMDM